MCHFFRSGACNDRGLFPAKVASKPPTGRTPVADHKCICRASQKKWSTVRYIGCMGQDHRQDLKWVHCSRWWCIKKKVSGLAGVWGWEREKVIDRLSRARHSHFSRYCYQGCGPKSTPLPLLLGERGENRNQPYPLAVFTSQERESPTTWKPVQAGSAPIVGRKLPCNSLASCYNNKISARLCHDGSTCFWPRCQRTLQGQKRGDTPVPGETLPFARKPMHMPPPC